VCVHGIEITINFDAPPLRGYSGFKSPGMQVFKQIRIKDIADRCHVSPGTVDRVLHNRGEVSAETRVKVLKVVDELNYSPNLIASTLASKKAHLFAALLPTPLSRESYWAGPAAGVRMRASELQHYGLHLEIIQFDQFSPADFTEKTKLILSLNPDGVVFAPFFIRESHHFTGQLREKRIPFVFIDSDIKGQGQLAYVGQNSFRCGYLSGKLMSMMTPGGGLLQVIHFGKEMDNQNHLIQREKGFYNWFKKHEPGRKIKTLEIAATGCADDICDIISGLTDQKPLGIFVTNSKVYLAAGAIEKSHFPNIRLIGHDLLKENIRYLRKGIVDCLICQRPEEQGYSSVDKLFRSIIQKAAVKQHYYTPIDIVVKENLAYYQELKF
jgi:LacI family transcriptional regulator